MQPERAGIRLTLHRAPKTDARVGGIDLRDATEPVELDGKEWIERPLRASSDEHPVEVGRENGRGRRVFEGSRQNLDGSVPEDPSPAKRVKRTTRRRRIGSPQQPPRSPGDRLTTEADEARRCALRGRLRPSLVEPGRGDGRRPADERAVVESERVGILEDDSRLYDVVLGVEPEARALEHHRAVHFVEVVSSLGACAEVEDERQAPIADCDRLRSGRAQLRGGHGRPVARASHAALKTSRLTTGDANTRRRFVTSWVDRAARRPACARER